MFIQTMVELLKGEKDVLTKRSADSDKELRELSGKHTLIFYTIYSILDYYSIMYVTNIYMYIYVI